MRNLAATARRVIIGSLAASLALLAVAAPAHAAANPPELTFTGNDLVPNLGAPDLPPYVEGNVGDTFEFVNEDNDNQTVSLRNDNLSTPLIRMGDQICSAIAPCLIPWRERRTVRIIGLDEIFGAGVIIWRETGPSPGSTGLFYVIPGPVPPETTSSGSGPATVIQQFGFPASGDCNAAAPAGLDWAGVPSGGWGSSWAEWMNDGRGGAVCTRTLVYRPGLDRWAIE